MTAFDDHVTELNISQYSFGESGISACTVIACSVVKLFLGKFKSSDNTIPSVSELTTAVEEGITCYRTLPTATRSHLSVDELGSFMSGTVQTIGDSPIQGLLTTPNHFQDMFAQARSRADPDQYIAIVITKPPETVCVILPPANLSSEQGKYIFFDSHSRPQLGFSGSYMVECGDERGLISRLQAVFTPLVLEGGGVGQEEYMQLMYNMFEGTVFQSM